MSVFQALDEALVTQSGQTSRSELRAAVANMGWLGASRVVQALIAFLVGAWVARHLGPDNYGVLAFALAWVTLFASLFRAGANTVLVRNFVTDPERAGTAFGTVLVLRTVGAGTGMTAAVVVAWLDGSSEVAITLIAVLAVAQCIKATDVAEFWFQARVESKYSVLANATALAVSAILRVALILLELHVEAFAWALAFEWVLQTLLMWLALARYGQLSWRSLRASLGYARSYSRDAWPLVVSGVASTIYLRIDQVMLERAATLDEVGQYAVVSGLIQMGFFVPTVVCASVFPALLRAREQDTTRYEARLRDLFASLLWLAMAMAMACSVSAQLIIPLVFGEQFAPATPMLEVAAWSWVFVFFMMASGRHLVAENLTGVVMTRTVLGAVTNVSLNALLIPHHGGLGAAWATLVSFGVASLVGNLPSARSRGLTLMFFRALDPRQLTHLRRLLP